MRGWGREVSRLHAADAEGPVWGDVVLIMIVFCSFTEVLKPRCYFKDACNGVTFFPVEVPEGLW
jgi:hypothetical protein